MRPRTLDRSWLGLTVGLALGMACAGCDDDPPFLGLSQLCGERASDLCDARAGCCGPEDEAACLAREVAACELSKQRLEAEALDYDAVQAARTRGTMRGALDACSAVPELAGFFTGGLALGNACERDGQCASGRCGGQPLTCIDVAPRPLCAAP